MKKNKWKDKLGKLCEENKIYLDKTGFEKLEALDVDDYFKVLIPKVNDFIKSNNIDITLKVGEIGIYARKKDFVKREESILEYYNDEDLINKKFPEPEWLIENQIPLGEVGIIAGKRGERKTFITLYQAICIASGMNCIDDKVPKARNVLFISEEDSIINLALRIKTIKKGMGIEKKKLPIKYFTLNNLKLDACDEKMQKFREILEEFKPSLIIVDTFQRCISFDADKDNKEISEFFIQFILPLSKEYNCSWLFVHHLRKGLAGVKQVDDYLDEIRGGSEIVNFPRFVLSCQVPKNSKEIMVFRVLKMSYSEIPEAKAISFTNSDEEGLKIEYLGKPEDVISSAANCARAIKEWLFEKNITDFKTKQLKDAAEEIGYKRTMILEGLKILKDSQFLISDKRGHYIINKEVFTQKNL